MPALQQWYRQAGHLPFDITHDAPAAGALLIHGLLGSPAEMRPLAELFAARGLDVRVPLIPGMAGEVDRLRTVTSREWISRLRDEWDALVDCCPRRVLLGYSLGGALALQIAESSGIPPDLIILLAPFTRHTDRRARLLPLIKHVMREISLFGHLDPTNPGVRDWFARTMPGLDLEDRETVAEMVWESTLATETLDQMRRLGAGVVARAHELRIPTLVIQGNRDDVVRPRDTHDLVRRLPSIIAYHEIPGDHMLPYPAFESWPAVARLVDRTLAAWVDAGTS